MLARRPAPALPRRARARGRLHALHAVYLIRGESARADGARVAEATAIEFLRAQGRHRPPKGSRFRVAVARAWRARQAPQSAAAADAARRPGTPALGSTSRSPPRSHIDGLVFPTRGRARVSAVRRRALQRPAACARGARDDAARAPCRAQRTSSRSCTRRLERRGGVALAASAARARAAPGRDRRDPRRRAARSSTQRVLRRGRAPQAAGVRRRRSTTASAPRHGLARPSKRSARSRRARRAAASSASRSSWQFDYACPGRARARRRSRPASSRSAEPRAHIGRQARRMREGDCRSEAGSGWSSRASARGWARPDRARLLCPEAEQPRARARRSRARALSPSLAPGERERSEGPHSLSLSGGATLSLSLSGARAGREFSGARRSTAARFWRGVDNPRARATRGRSCRLEAPRAPWHAVGQPAGRRPADPQRRHHLPEAVAARWRPNRKHELCVDVTRARAQRDARARRLGIVRAGRERAGRVRREPRQTATRACARNACSRDATARACAPAGAAAGHAPPPLRAASRDGTRRRKRAPCAAAKERATSRRRADRAGSWRPRRPAAP